MEVSRNCRSALYVSLLKLSVVNNIHLVCSLCPHKGTYFCCVSANKHTHTTLATMIFTKFDSQETYCLSVL